ncbi:glutamate racemase [Zhongshania sp. BJYM1]|jgi:glutamate racemase|uniref:glutamate racemase n=1 Tax=Zhongshania aquatica TaxID=2965069 RepID=UPI0022B41527|nr:glutamate racemase [Marortus sp. BJYM1]
MHAPRVLVFDSGVGSLSIGAAIHQLIPQANLLYAMDHGGFPYGEWQEEELVTHICQAVTAVLQRHAADILVMACNSASTAVLPALRSILSIPVIGVVPAIKPAAQRSVSGVIGLLATPGTVARAYTAQLINDFASHCCVIPVGSRILAPAIESLFWHDSNIDEVLQQIKAALSEHPRAAEMDTVVLACTHFPLMQKPLSELLPNLQWIDSGEAIARRVAHVINELNLPLDSAGEHGLQEVLILGKEEATPILKRRLEDSRLCLIDY